MTSLTTPDGAPLTMDDELARVLAKVESGEPFLDDLGSALRHLDGRTRAARKALRRIGFLLFRRDDPDMADAYRLMLRSLRAAGSPERLVMRSRRLEVSVEPLASFTVSMNLRARQKQLGRYAPENPLVDKVAGYRFADEVGVRRPQPVTDDPVEHSKLEVIPGTVIKPANWEGSRGVYLVHATDHILDARHSQILTSEAAFRERFEQDLEHLPVHKDSWIVEELVYEDRVERRPARDLKYYTFYGRVVMVMEVQRFPQRRICWWDASGRKVDTGRYRALDFDGAGIDGAEVALAERLGSAVPAPFLRIDLLRSDSGPVLGEFTGHPGGYEQFDRVTDIVLGNHFLDAEGRLVADLVAGKRFDAFLRCFPEHGTTAVARIPVARRLRAAGDGARGTTER